MPRWLKAAFGLAILIVVTTIMWTAYHTYVFYARRMATIALMSENLKRWQGFDEAYGKRVASGIQSVLDELEDSIVPDLDPPRLYAAYIDPAPSIYPDDAPILTLCWLEYDCDVDGFDLYSEGGLCATITGWNAEADADREALLELHDNTYDRFIFVDVPFSSAHECHNNRDVVRLTQDQLQGNLEIQLRTDGPCGPRIVLAVADSVFETRPGQAVRENITTP